MFSTLSMRARKPLDQGVPSLVIDLTPTGDVVETAPMGYSPAMSPISPSSLPMSSLAPANPPAFARRHSYNVAGTKPLRSSPLAGPALSSDGSVAESEGSKVGLNSPRVASFPDLAASLTPPPEARRSRPKSSQGFIPALPPSLSALSEHVPSEATSPDSPSRHSFFLGLEKRRNNRKSTHSPIEVPPVACPPVPEWALQERNSSAERREQARASPLSRPKSFHASTSTPLLSTSAGNQADNTSWLTTNPYDATPRFSRLGLAASNVVLPVSAREHRRMSRASSSTSIQSAFTVTPASGAQSSRSRPESPTSLSRSSTSSNVSSWSSPNSNIPSLSLTRSSSNASSNDSILTPPPPVMRSLAPSIASSSDIATIAEEEDPEPDTGRFSLKRIRKTSVARMKSLRLKSSKSHNDIHAAHPELQFESFELGAARHRTHHHRNNALASPPPLPELKAMKSNVTVIHQPVEEKKCPDAAASDVKVMGRKGTIKKLWKTLGWGRA